jgi:Ni/Fe-hydrogenase subunit HybB-like protein
MHQSSLGALMLLAGQQVHPLWQTPWLPLLYVWAASFMGFAFVGFVLQVCHLVWDRPIDNEALAEMSRIAAWLILAWLVFRLLDLAIRGSLPLAFAATTPSVLFWVEMAMLLAAGILLFRAGKSQNIRLAFQGNILAALGGMLYRFDPTTLVYRNGTASFYFPSTIELLIGIGFVSLAIAAFSILAKILPILPAPTKLWYAMESARWEASFEIPDDACDTQFAAAD